MKAMTTLNAIRAKHPCKSGWTKLLKHLGKVEPDDEPLAIVTILESNGLGDAIWCLRVLDKSYSQNIRRFALACARSVEHLMQDEWSKNALIITEKYLNGEVTLVEMKNAAYADAATAADADAATAAAAAAARAAAYAAYAARDAAATARAAAYAAYAATDAAAYAATDAAATARSAAYTKIEKLFKEFFA